MQVQRYTFFSKKIVEVFSKTEILPNSQGDQTKGGLDSIEYGNSNILIKHLKNLNWANLILINYKIKNI